MIQVLGISREQMNRVETEKPLKNPTMLLFACIYNMTFPYLSGRQN